MKLINLGLPKSGTSTLQAALRASGMDPLHWVVRQKGVRTDLGNPETYVGYRIYRDFLAGKDPLGSLGTHDAIAQMDLITDSYSIWPQTDHGLLCEIRRRYPDCVFLLLTRSPDKVLTSTANWLDLRERMAQRGVPGLPAPFARDDAALRAWINGHFKAIRSWFGADPRFLEVDIDDTDAPERLGTALRIPIVGWGQENVTQEPNKERRWQL